MKRKARSHKLSRPSILAEQAQHRVDRRADVWEVPPSPQKPAPRPKPRHDEGKRDDEGLPSSPPGISADTPIESGEHEEAEVEAPLRHPSHRQSLPNSQIENVQIQKELRPGVARCTVLSYNPRKGPGYIQCSNSGTQATDTGHCCQVHIQKPATVRCGAAIRTKDGVNGQCRQIAQKETTSGPRCNKHLGSKQYVKQIGQDQPISTQEIIPSIETRVDTQAQGKRNATEQEESPKPAKSSKKQHIGNAPIMTRNALKSNLQETTATEKPKQDVTKRRETEADEEDEDEADEEANFEDDEDDEDIEDDDDHEDDEVLEGEEKNKYTSTHKGRQPVSSALDPLDRVFQFIKSEDRSGRCKTQLGRSIMRLCESACAIFLEDDLTMKTVTESTENVCGALKAVRDVSKNRQAMFKTDAYGYIFLALTEYLSSLYTWFEGKFENPANSREAMENLSSLVRDILSFNDTLASWKLAIHQRYQGDKFTRDVGVNLISPLREVSKTFNKLLQILLRNEESHKMIADTKRRLEEEEQKQDLILEKNKRWLRWQDLHIARMLCEPDPFKRKKLCIKKLEDANDVDANGFPFVRVPLFKSRPALQLPRRLSSNDDWTDAQEVALLDGLRKYKGELVFHKIFQKYCRPGGPLRNFTVEDILIKAAWVKAGYVRLKEENGWEIPEWVAQMPPLP